MTPTQTGWMVFVAALGMMLGLLSVDIAKLGDWSEVTTPGFVANLLGHLAVVIAAFVGGKIMPEKREGKYTRVTDSTIGLTDV